MYIPPAFNETDPITLHDFVERHSFGTFVSQVDELPFATHLPFLLDRAAGPNGTLIGHMAAANPQCLKARDQTVLAVFSGPHSYISPTWYEAENVVPTWNYVAVHAYGKVELIDDQSELLDVVRRTSEFYEKAMPAPWSFDVTSTFVTRLLSQIIGFKIRIEKIEGKWKLNQNQPAERQEKVVRALQERHDENSQSVAGLMRERLSRTGNGQSD